MKTISKINIILLTILSFLLIGCDKDKTKPPSGGGLNITITNETGTKYYADHNFNVNLICLEDSSKIKTEIAKVIQDVDFTKFVEYDKIWEHYKYTDADPNDSTKIVYFYSQQKIDASSCTNKTHTGISREHVWCQSKGDSINEATLSKAGGHDLYNVRPEETAVNTKRNNNVFGAIRSEVSPIAIYYQSTTTVVGYYGGGNFIPVDQNGNSIKGDIARILFYYSIMYGYELKNIVADTTYVEILKWNKEDPVSQIEINRNNYVETIQGNRNPFVDYPEMANYIWG